MQRTNDVVTISTDDYYQLKKYLSGKIQKALNEIDKTNIKVKGLVALLSELDDKNQYNVLAEGDQLLHPPRKTSPWKNYDFND
jgi:hypothetical protein